MKKLRKIANAACGILSVACMSIGIGLLTMAVIL